MKCSVNSSPNMSDYVLCIKLMCLMIRITQVRSSDLAEYLGCFVDGGIIHERILETELYELNDNSRDKCIRECFDNGYNFSGTEDGDECWCGDVIKRYEKVSESECDDECPGNSKETCGANWRLSLYNLTVLYATTIGPTVDVTTPEVTENDTTPILVHTFSSTDGTFSSISTDDIPETNHAENDRKFPMTIIYITVPVVLMAAVGAVILIAVLKQRTKRKAMVPEAHYNNATEFLQTDLAVSAGVADTDTQENYEISPNVQNVTDCEYNTMTNETSNTAKPVIDATYDHISASNKPLLDKTYSRLSEHQQLKTVLVSDTYSHLDNDCDDIYET